MIVYNYRAYTNLLIIILIFGYHLMSILPTFMSTFFIKLLPIYLNPWSSKSEYALTGIVLNRCSLCQLNKGNAFSLAFTALWPSSFLLFRMCCWNYYLKSLALCWLVEISLYFRISYFLLFLTFAYNKSSHFQEYMNA